MAARTIGVVGLGYVGLTTAVCLASRGFKTVGIEIDEDKLRAIGRGKAPFFEKGLTRMLSSSLERKKLDVTSDYGALTDSEIDFVTVGTPAARNGAANLTAVKQGTSSIGRVIRKSSQRPVVVIKSTVTPGTTVDVVKPTLEFETGMKLGDFGLATNPEFLREGRAVSDTMSPDRIVIGTLDRFSEASLVSLYKGFLKQLPTVVKTTPTNAELIKYASNSFLATKVTFVNEIANLCSKFPGADVSTVARGMGLDMRIGPQFLKAGLGYGGSCFPKDVKALLAAAREKGVRLGVAAAADSGNEARPSVAVELAERLIGDLSKKRIAVLGLAFKPGSDDMREAVSVKVVKLLQKRGARVSAYDPVANSNARRVIGNTVRFCSSARSCLTGSDCCIVVTEWSEFAELRPGQLKRLMRTPTVVDGRRILRPELFIRAGVKFAAVGLGPSAY